MLKNCSICKKGALTGKVLARKGQYKAKGGTGSKIARWSKRKFLPNLQKVHIVVNGTTKKVYICAKCIKKGDFKKATPRKPKPTI
ncbi:MAG: L28 family ribosomal protein [Candidatus Omnitrophota bacterium]